MIEWIMNTNSDKMIMDVMTKIMADHTIIFGIFSSAVGYILYLALPRGQYKKLVEWWRKWRSRKLTP